jgi:hypothetical protein
MQQGAEILVILIIFFTVVALLTLIEVLVFG